MTNTCTYIIIVTNGFDKHALDAEARLLENVQYVSTPLTRTIRCIKRGYADAIAGHFARRLSRRIGRVVPFGRHLGAAQLSTIVANVKDLRRNVVKKGQETTNTLGNVRFSCQL
jgi:hypothetical protein